MYRGIHGTCRSMGSQIHESNTFIPSVAGRAGQGCYFWRYHSNDDYARFLSYRWWKAQNERGSYNKSGIHDTNCSILQCTFKIQNEDYDVLDLSHGEPKEHIRELLKTELLRVREDDSSKDLSEEIIVSSLFQLYVDRVSQNQPTPVKLVISDVAIPKGSGGVIGKYIGAAAEAIISLDPSCIIIENYEEVDSHVYI